MKSALTGDESAPSRALELVRSLESCDWRHCEEMQNSLGLAEGSVAAIYVDALRWASTMEGEEFIGSTVFTNNLIPRLLLRTQSPLLYNRDR